MTALPEDQADERSAWWPSIVAAVLLFILLRVSLSVVAAVASVLFHAPPPCFHNGVVDWPTMPTLYSTGIGAAFLGVWERWDACWYLRIATFGYGAGDPGTAFFPLYPAAIRVAAPFFAGNFVVAAFAVSGAAYVVAMTVLHKMVRGDFDAETADRSITYISIFPTAFFFFAPFSESLFLALALACLYLARTKRFGAAALVGLLIGVSRAQGALLALPLAWEALRLARSEMPRVGASLRVVTAAAAAIAPVVGFIVYLNFSTDAAGMSPFEAIRQHWGYAIGPPWQILGYAWHWMLDPSNAGFADIQLLTAFHLVLVVLFVGLAIVGARMLPLAYTLYLVPQLLVVVIGSPATPLASVSRYMLVMFPIFVVVALIARGRPWFDRSWLIASTLGLGVLLVAIIQNEPVG
jgi:hypothetical protein